MAYIPCNYGSSGGTTGSTTELCFLSISDTSQHSITLTDDIDNYTWLVFALTPMQSNMIICDDLNKTILAVISPNIFKSTATLTTRYGSGSSGSIISATCTIKYVSDTSITVKNTNANTRLFRLYGLK